MKADESRNGSKSIPYGGITVNAVLSEALAGCSVRVVTCGVVVPRGASVEDLAAICDRLIRVGTKMSVTVQFCIGDVYQCTAPYSRERQLLYESVEREFGAKVADRLREFGRVAKCWPCARRNPEICWAYYRTHKPGVPGKPDVKVEKSPTVIKAGKSVAYEGGLAREGFDANGKRYLIVEVK